MPRKDILVSWAVPLAILTSCAGSPQESAEPRKSKSTPHVADKVTPAAADKAERKAQPVARVETTPPPTPTATMVAKDVATTSPPAASAVTTEPVKLVAIPVVTPAAIEGETSASIASLASQIQSVIAPSATNIEPAAIQTMRGQLAGLRDKIGKEIPDGEPYKQVLSDAIEEAVGITEEAERATDPEERRKMLFKAQKSVEDALQVSRDRIK